MAEIHETGREGEEMAADYLKSRGYIILDQNWRFGSNEIDIIAQDGRFLVIVEVKTRHSTDYGEPESFVTRQKQRLLIRAANAFIYKNNIEMETRFDIIAVTLSKREPEINHIEDAFYPTL